MSETPNAPENSEVQNTKKSNDYRTFSNLALPKKTVPEGYPGSIVVDGQTLKLRATDLSILVFPVVVPPPPAETLQSVTTLGNTTSVGIVMSGPGSLDVTGTQLSITGGNVVLNTGTLVVPAVGVTAATLTSTGISFVQDTMTLSGASQKIFTNTGSLMLQAPASIELVPGSSTLSLTQATNFQCTGDLAFNVDNDFFIRPSTSGDIFLRPTPGNTVLFEALSAGYASFILNNCMWYTAGSIPSLTAGSGVNPATMSLSPFSNQTCGRIHIEINSLPIVFGVTLNLPHTPSITGDFQVLITAAEGDFNVNTFKVRVGLTTPNSVLFTGNPTTLGVSVDWYYLIIASTT